MPLLSHDSPNFKSLLDSIFQHTPLPAPEAERLRTFVAQHYLSLPDDELPTTLQAQQKASLFYQWSLIQRRDSEEVLCQVFNPTKSEHGWNSPHTVIALCQQDRPFLVDSLMITLSRLGISVHFLVHSGNMPIKRDSQGKLIDILAKAKEAPEGFALESVIYVEIDHQVNLGKHLDKLKEQVLRVMKDVKQVTDDYPAIRQLLKQDIQILSKNPAGVDPVFLKEQIEFLTWLDEGHFVFLGCLPLQLSLQAEADLIKPSGERLGLYRSLEWIDLGLLNREFVAAKEKVFSNDPLIISKSAYQSPVHRDTKFDVVMVKQFKNGKVVGVSRYIGLYTSSAYQDSVINIPLLRRKVNFVLEKSGYSQSAHDGKALFNVLNTLPREELFQMEDPELFDTAIRILQIQESRKVRLFLRRETFGRYWYCMVFLPKEIYTSELRFKVQKLLVQFLKGSSSTFTLAFLESALCRVDYVVNVEPSSVLEEDLTRLQDAVVSVARDWHDQLKNALTKHYGEHKAVSLYQRYQYAFSLSYQETYSGAEVVGDVKALEFFLQSVDPIGLYLYRKKTDTTSRIHLKIFSRATELPLSKVLPIIENMGLQVLEERPDQLQLGTQIVRLSDFETVSASEESVLKSAEVFREAFIKIWKDKIENDGFNRLISLMGFSWRQVMLFRACAKYLIQIGVRYSQAVMETALVESPGLTWLLMNLFDARFDPALKTDLSERDLAQQALKQQFDSALLKVSHFDHDRVFRYFWQLIRAMVRTNFFQTTPEGAFKTYLSFKLDSSRLPEMPKPLPKHEIYVFSRSVEGIHLRMGDVARGGLRWSDRFDFRTEVLSLVKAQQIKNSVIVPVGAKGCFVPKFLSPQLTREETQKFVIESYQTFIRGLLDLTDNVVNQNIQRPDELVVYDAPDPYLVVAADKGTASFSDIANQLSAEYGFWLGDAFASGGSRGYDHKKIGITSRGVWEAIKRHFFTLGRNVEQEPFTVVGIGDMSGDVFGNGMLFTPYIRLIAAFNHQHIFLDPTPDEALSFQERQRLFALPRSSWQDYSPEKISQGGGVFDRSAKTIELSLPAQKALGLEQSVFEPNELIQAILKSPVDLLFNGGIGTYIKASFEKNTEVGDRQNDALRVDASDLRCLVLAEGGNLGVTQRGRIEFSLRGGLIQMDAVDNSAGVDCSDHEVNIKIFVNELVKQGHLSLEERNQLLADMQEEVAALVLRNNYDQSQTIGLGLHEESWIHDIYIRLILQLTREAFLDRELEAIPSDREIAVRRANSQGFTAPEFSVLMSYTKSLIRKDLLKSSLPDEPYFHRYLLAEFPNRLCEHYKDLLPTHRLAREIIATQVTNAIVKFMGIEFFHRMYDESGASVDMAIRAFEVVSHIFSLSTLWAHIEELDGKTSAKLQYKMMQIIRKSLRRSCRWLLRHHRHIEIEKFVDIFSPYVAKLRSLQSKFLNPALKEFREQQIDKFHQQGVPKSLSRMIVGFDHVSPIFDIIEVSLNDGCQVELVASTYMGLSERLSLTWLRDALIEFASQGDYWGRLSASALHDQLDRVQTTLARSILRTGSEELSFEERFLLWAKHNEFLLNRWKALVEEFDDKKPNVSRLVNALCVLGDFGSAVTTDQALSVFKNLSKLEK